MPIRSAWATSAAIAGLARQPSNLVQPGLERRQALGLDRGRVEIGVVGDADLAVRILGRFLDDLAGPLLRQIVEHGEHAVVRLVGRDRRVPGPGAVGVLVEIVARQRRSRPCPPCRSRRCRARAWARPAPRQPAARSLRPAAAELRPAGVAQPASAVLAARTAIRRFMSSLPSGNLLDLRALPRSVTPWPPLAADPPAPSDERHDISYQRHAQPDHGTARSPSPARHRTAARQASATRLLVAASTCKAARSAWKPIRLPTSIAATRKNGVVTGLDRKVMAAAIGIFAAQRHADQRGADDLQARHHQEDADEQAEATPRGTERRVKRHRSRCADALAERLQPAAVLALPRETARAWP